MRIMILFLMFGFSTQSLYCFDKIIGCPPNDDVIRRIKAILPDDPIIVEGGTYDGTDTLELTALLPKATIYTFEAVPQLFNKLAERFKYHLGYSIRSYDYALSNQTGNAIMYLSEEENAPGIVSMSSSLLAPKEHLLLSPTTLFKKTIEVKTITLDKWAEENSIEAIDFLKLDIESNELDVLMASPKMVSTVKAILTEVGLVEAREGQFQFEDVKVWMEEQGFELDCLYMNGCGWFGDALFIRKK